MDKRGMDQSEPQDRWIKGAWTNQNLPFFSYKQFFFHWFILSPLSLSLSLPLSLCGVRVFSDLHSLPLSLSPSHYPSLPATSFSLSLSLFLSALSFPHSF